MYFSAFKNEWHSRPWHFLHIFIFHSDVFTCYITLQKIWWNQLMWQEDNLCVFMFSKLHWRLHVFVFKYWYLELRSRQPTYFAFIFSVFRGKKIMSTHLLDFLASFSKLKQTRNCRLQSVFKNQIKTKRLQIDPPRFRLLFKRRKNLTRIFLDQKT